MRVRKSMAIVRVKEARKMSNEQLASKLSELRLELAKLRAQVRSGAVKNPGRIRELKRSIARILTVLNERGQR